MMTLAYTRCELRYQVKDGQVGSYKSGLGFKWKTGTRDTYLEVVHIAWNEITKRGNAEQEEFFRHEILKAYLHLGNKEKERRASKGNTETVKKWKENQEHRGKERK